MKAAIRSVVLYRTRRTVDDGSLEAGAPVALFPTRVGSAIQRASTQQYIVSPDGSRF